MMEIPLTVRDALLLILDHVDYLENACACNEMVAAALPESVIRQAYQALAEDSLSRKEKL